MRSFTRPFSRLVSSIQVFATFFLAAQGAMFVRGQEVRIGFDVAPFALPGGPAGEIRFEETRDVVAVDVVIDGPSPDRLGLSYLQDNWPKTKLERSMDLTQPTQFGWTKVDDWFNGKWRRAKTIVSAHPDARLRITFSPLTSEFPEERDYDVTFRRTLGLRLEGVDPKTVRRVMVWTRSAPARTTLKVELNAGGATPAGAIGWDGYNARVRDVHPGKYCKTQGELIQWEKTGPAAFELVVDHMTPAHRYSGDDGHIRFILGDDSFTISLASLEGQGPIWFAEKGIFIARADDPTTFDQYRERNAHARTIAAACQGPAGAELRRRVPGPAPAPCRGLEPRVQERSAAVLAGPERGHHAGRDNRPADPRGRHPAVRQRRRPWWRRARPVLLRPRRLAHAGAIHRPRPCPRVCSCAGRMTSILS